MANLEPAEIAELLCRARIASGLSQERLAAICGVDPRTIAHYENGEFPVAASRVISWLFTEYSYSLPSNGRARGRD